jgi:Cu+-exporting ATPase
MVAAAQRSRAPIQKLADVVASWFVPAVVATAVLTFIVWALIGPQPSMAYGLINAVAVLIIACPCALGLATPMSIMVAIGKGAQAGVLFKDAEAIKILRQVDTLVMDKTGTLTEGRPKLIAVLPPRASRRRRCFGWRQASNEAASIRWLQPSSRAPRSGAWRSPGPTISNRTPAGR